MDDKQKAKAFINVAQELGYEIQDLHDMDDRIKNWIADLVDMSSELDTTGDIQGLSDDGSSPLERLRIAKNPQKKKAPMVHSHHAPVTPPPIAPEPEKKKVKKEWVPDTIDPTVDIMKSIRNSSHRS